ncbi:MAG: sigma-54-dependent Fis family transcriptional regulator [Lentisphaerae bacterium]|nr:sigma-54-dependent Fis family transcriptional regulator [Lentisphaerota bacterium]
MPTGAKAIALTAEQREFLELVSAAAFANPFGEGRAALDLKIAGLPPGTAPEERLAATVARVRGFLEKNRFTRQTVAALGPADRKRVQYAFFFDVFHRFTDRLDGLIERQAESGAEPCPVPFARDVLAALRDAAPDTEETRGIFATFYQLRRAYYFIDRALIGRSAVMRELRRALWNNVFTHDMRLYTEYLRDRMEDFSTLLLGETGTGKGAAAAAIGRSGFIPFDESAMRFTESFTRAFLAINLSQFPETLIESELFGHRKGAFTGAVEAHDGVFARCSPHGAIFIDEIGEVSVPVQIKLLQVLQERSFSPVGSHERRRFRGRVIAATNRPLDVLRRERLLRDDFFYRLSSDVITVPPLRRRLAEDPAELDDLIRLTVRRITGRDSDELHALIRGAIEDRLGPDYAWPGNVRELEQCVRRILLTRAYAGDTCAAADDLRSRVHRRIDLEDYGAAELLGDYCRLLYERHGTYEEVARRAGLDRRTAKKYISA